MSINIQTSDQIYKINVKTTNTVNNLKFIIEQKYDTSMKRFKFFRIQEMSIKNAHSSNQENISEILLYIWYIVRMKNNIKLNYK